MGIATTPMLLLLLFLPLSSPSSAPSSPDAPAMQSLAASLNPTPPGWYPSSDPCTPRRWPGVTCSVPFLRVTSISLNDLTLSGPLPSSPLSSLTSLVSLNLQNNEISSPLPALPPSLQELLLSDNLLSALPPSLFSSLPNLHNLSLDRNPFLPWTIPSALSQCFHLSYFTAMKSRLTGPLPDFLASMPSLRYLRLSYNSLVGTIPASFASSNLHELDLNNQETGLSGSIVVLAHMTELETVMLQVNNFSGPIPDLSNCTRLAELQLRNNILTGPVPPSMTAMQSLRKISLSKNLLQGPMPGIDPNVWEDRLDSGNCFCKAEAGPCDPRVSALLAVAEGFGYPLTIATSWKGNDPCVNWMFVVCDPQGNLKALNFGGQRFGGTISPAIAEITTLTHVVLNDNNLTGTIPEALAGMPQLQSLDVSNNNLSGRVPNFNSKIEFISSNNLFLGKDVGSTDEENGIIGIGRSHMFSLVWIAVMLVAVFIVVAGIMGRIIYRRRSSSLLSMKPKGKGSSKVQASARMDPQALLKASGEISSLRSVDNMSDTYMVEAEATAMPMQVLQQATGGFSDANILGTGGFGVVYKGELPDGTFVAVKRMECGNMGNKGMAEFHAEIAVLTKVRHRHLVALLGYCIEGNERLLVYEYMAEGTLGQHLFDSVKKGNGRLGWKQRLVIALDVARGLEYLHNLAHRSFIHRDLKPSNILLDSDMRAKVSDFGLVKLAADESSVHTRLAGTFGYLAPEYAATGRVTTKVDVYAYGVVLMELITGRKALDETLPDEHSHLVSWFRKLLLDKDNLRKVVESSIYLDDDDVKSLSAVADLAGHCTAREANQRPDMGHIVNALAPLVDQWKPSANFGDSYSTVFFRHEATISDSSTDSTSVLSS